MSRHQRRSKELATLVRALNPTVRAYGLALVPMVAPSAANIVIAFLRHKISLHDATKKIRQLVARQLLPNKFAAICAYLVGASSLLPIPLLVVMNWYSQRNPSLLTTSRVRSLSALIRFVMTFIVGVLTFRYLNARDSKEIDFSAEQKSTGNSGNLCDFRPQGALPARPAPPRPRLAGRTLDLTLFGAVRAADVVLSNAWDYWSSNRKQSKLIRGTEQMAFPVLFVASSAIVMWNWFFVPHRLPKAYNTWISTAAQIDSRLVEALRQARMHAFVYGKDTGYGPMLGEMCKEHGFPEEWGDPARTIPIPEELYHASAGTHTGANCEYHAIKRFYRAWQFSMAMYLPLNLALLLRRPSDQRSLRKAFLDASQSSSFLGGFIALFYYGVCLGRRRLVPKLYGKGKVNWQDIDGGIGVAIGCALCGWPILMEKAPRRQEIAFFVLPRALATLLPRRYDKEYMGREEMAFATSAAVLLTAAHYQPHRIRGVFGRLTSTLFV